MKLADLSPDVKFIYMAMSKSALFLKDRGCGKDDFVKLAEEIWQSTELSDFNELNKTLIEQMKKDIAKAGYVKL